MLCLMYLFVDCVQLPGNVRKMSSPVRMDTAYAAYGTAMVTTTVETTVTNSVVSNLVVVGPKSSILECQMT